MRLKKLALSIIGFKIALKYKFNILFFVVLAPLSLLVWYYLWKSIFEYTGSTVIQGFTLVQMTGYFVLSMIVGMFTWSEIDKWMEQDIRTGHITTWILKPLSYFSQAMFLEFGITWMVFMLQTIPVIIIGFVFFSLEIAPLLNILGFVISLFLAFFLTFNFTFLIGLTSFWMKNITGIRRLRRILVMFLSGGMIPLTFFPEVFQNIFHFLPFEYMRFVPINIYLGTYTPMTIFLKLGLQCLWILIIYTLIGLIWKKASEQAVGVGI